MMRLKDKVAIVTGGSRGIGRGIVKLFAEEGAKVVIADINSETGELAETEFKNENLQVAFHRTDVGNEGDVMDLIKFTAGRFGGVDILINNAAVNYRKSVTETTLEEWNSLMNVNLTGAFLCSKYAIPEMRKRGGGSIVNIVSWHAETTITRLAAYAGAKGGLTALTRQMALDYGRDQIRVNAVGPSTVDTPMLQKTFGSLENPEEAMEDSLAFNPMGRFGTVDDIAKACLFFASDDSAFVSGQTLMVDGGQINKVARPITFD